MKNTEFVLLNQKNNNRFYFSIFIYLLLIINLFLYPFFSFGQQIKNVPEAFNALSPDPEIIHMKNNIKVPSAGGHLQGVQVIEKNGIEKLLVSGSSNTKAYVLQVDLTTRKTDKLITLMKTPYKHAGGIQVSEQYLVVGIEDDIAKTSSKVCLYSYQDKNLNKARPNFTLHRDGKAKLQTAGATGILELDNEFLVVVGNWDCRNWDFYRINPNNGEHEKLSSFIAPNNWGSYQSINLIKDEAAIYAIGFYKKELNNYSDLILVSRLGTFEPIMEKIISKTFNCKNGVDFNNAVGLQVDKKGDLHFWSTQRDAQKEIIVNRFSQK